MVSSFKILTNIRVDPETAKAFNAFAKSFSFGSIKSHNIPEYFDQPHLTENLENYKNGPIGKVFMSHFMDNWRFNKHNVLYDSCEKFHAAISALHYFIQEFFIPRGVSLNGTIVGCNTERPHAYVYHVNDNNIILDYENTKKMLKEHERLIHLFHWERKPTSKYPRKENDYEYESTWDYLVVLNQRTMSQLGPYVKVPPPSRPALGVLEYTLIFTLSFALFLLIRFMSTL